MRRPGLLFPGGVLIDLPHDQVQERVAATVRALARGEPAIFEATFAEDGIVVAVDILAREGRTHTLIEVKSSTSIKPHHLWDAAVQAYVLRRAGVDVDAVEIMHLNDACRFPDLDDLFVREADLRAGPEPLPPDLQAHLCPGRHAGGSPPRGGGGEALRRAS